MLQKSCRSVQQVTESAFAQQHHNIDSQLEHFSREGNTSNLGVSLNNNPFNNSIRTLEQRFPKFLSLRNL